MRSFTTKLSLTLLIVTLSALFCIGLGYAETDKPFTISVINNTGVKMIQATYWLNHELPNCRGPYNICVAELKPGEDQTFNFGIASSKDRVFVTRWSVCHAHMYSEEELNKYKSYITSKIPTGTAIVKIYHKRFEIVAE